MFIYEGGFGAFFFSLLISFSSFLLHSNYFPKCKWMCTSLEMLFKKIIYLWSVKKGFRFLLHFSLLLLFATFCATVWNSRLFITMIKCSNSVQFLINLLYFQVECFNFIIACAKCTQSMNIYTFIIHLKFCCLFWTIRAFKLQEL